MADHDPLVVRQTEPPVVVILERDRIRQRLDENRARLRVAVQAMEDAARELTPAARIRHDPYSWVGGAFVVGFVLGFITARRR